jgi:hypothetical protein
MIDLVVFYQFAFHQIGHIRVEYGRALRTTAILCVLAAAVAFIPDAFCAERKSAVVQPRIKAFQPGERLTYEISWSNIVAAGTVVMEVKSEMLPEGRNVLRFMVTTRSSGAIEKFYPVNDAIQSIFDPQIMQSLSYSLKESHGKRKKHRDLAFDHVRKTVVNKQDDDPPETLTVPDPVQDALSMIYYLRTLADFSIGKVITVNVFDSGKNWSDEITVLGKETIKTPAGEFSTIKVSSSPKYEGNFLNKGEVFIWLTDDSRKVPVVMKSTTSVGAFVSTLTGLKTGADTR